MKKAINIVFDGPPGANSGYFVEIEDDQGKGLLIGEWTERPFGLWALRITDLPEERRRREDHEERRRGERRCTGLH